MRTCVRDGCGLGRALQSSSVPKELPADWRERLTDSVYNYHVNRSADSGKNNNRFEGDIASRPDDGRRRITPISGVVDRDLMWLDKIVPYEINIQFGNDEKKLILEAMADMAAKTCLIFREQNAKDTSYISFTRRDSGCWSYIGRQGGPQAINLAPGCVDKIGTVQHEVMHAISFYHEQSRLDRDDHVLVIWSNIQFGTNNTNFQKSIRTSARDLPYDYDSIMHYAFNQFAKNPKYPTLIPVQPAHFGRKNLGSRDVMSAGDVEKIRRIIRRDFDRSGKAVILATCAF
ncbi:putative Bone morphogenetic protein 1 [Hypsibius exemplaris]|uniref:Metalloendopeptidase n=1 Tax=Hypsibius exemplaris TaxID=2072580 RepID=A0A1W0WCA7_HYPEX|nr:putative Bone morphogenetic protein 1 [Hypsibius exemplaris]